MKKNALIIDYNNLKEFVPMRKTSLILLHKANFVDNKKFFKSYEFDIENLQFNELASINMLEELDYNKVKDYDLVVSSNNINLSAGVLLALNDIFTLNIDKDDFVKNYPNYRVDIYNKLTSAKDKSTLRQNTTLLAYLAYYDNKLYTNLG